MSDSDSSSSVEDEETRATPGAELASGILSSEQNKIQRDDAAEAGVERACLQFAHNTHT